MIIIDNIQQGTPEWLAEKIGKPGASNIDKIITNEGKISKQREGYLYELAGEIITGKHENIYKSTAMEIGTEREAESRNFFEFVSGTTIKQVGMIYKDDRKLFLCSPDGILENKNEGLELKNPLAKTQVKYLLEGKLPSEYFGQIQMSLYVTGYKYWNFVSYVPGMKPLKLRVEPDKKYQAILQVELELFCEELKTIVNKIKENL